MECHLDLSQLSKKVMAKKQGEMRDRSREENQMIRPKQKMNKMNRRSLNRVFQTDMETERERDCENRERRVIVGKGAH